MDRLKMYFLLNMGYSIAMLVYQRVHTVYVYIYIHYILYILFCFSPNLGEGSTYTNPAVSQLGLEAVCWSSPVCWFSLLQWGFSPSEASRHVAIPLSPTEPAHRACCVHWCWLERPRNSVLALFWDKVYSILHFCHYLLTYCSCLNVET